MSKTIKKYEKLISAAKASLIQKAKSKGIYENFGQDEIRKISKKKDEDVMQDKLDWESGNAVMRMILDFSEWCSNFDLETLKTVA